MQKRLIASVLGFTMILSLAACSSKPIVEPPPKIITETEYIKPSKPIVPTPPQLTMREIEFIIVTPENVDEVFEKLKSEDKAIFGVTDKGYGDIALNLADLRAYIQQQKKIIGIYESQYD